MTPIFDAVAGDLGLPVLAAPRTTADDSAVVIGDTAHAVVHTDEPGAPVATGCGIVGVEPESVVSADRVGPADLCPRVGRL